MSASLKERIRQEAGRRFVNPASDLERLKAAEALQLIAKRGSGPLPRWVRNYGRDWGVT